MSEETVVGPDATEVMRALAESEELEGLTFDRLEVQMGTPTHYVARVFVAGEKDYYSVHVRFD